jgi:REP element-mobilizing transposase RayT
MPNYRRAFVPGGCWFFTVNLLERRQTLLVDHIATLREAVAKTRQSQPYTIDAFVVLPDHLHSGGLRFANPPYRMPPLQLRKPGASWPVRATYSV